MSRDTRPSDPPPQYYPRAWPYLLAIGFIVVAMIALYALIVVV